MHPGACAEAFLRGEAKVMARVLSGLDAALRSGCYTLEEVDEPTEMYEHLVVMRRDCL